MKTLIISSGRSGSKFTFNKVFQIYKRLGLDNIHLIYEPFLWNFELKNFLDFSTLNFSRDNIDPKALDIHLKTPQYYIEKQNKNEFNDYSDHVLHRINKKKNIIVKINRSPARIQPFLESNQFDKIIYLYNNPLSLLSRLNNSYRLDGPPYFDSNFAGYIHPEIYCQYEELKEVVQNKKRTIPETVKNILIWFFTNQHLINFITSKQKANIFSLSTDFLKVDTIGSLQNLYSFFEVSFMMNDSADLIPHQFDNYKPFILEDNLLDSIKNYYFNFYYKNLHDLEIHSAKSNISRHNIPQIERIIDDKLFTIQNKYSSEYKDRIIKNIENLLSSFSLKNDLFSIKKTNSLSLSFLIDLELFIKHLISKKINNSKINAILSHYIQENI